MIYKIMPRKYKEKIKEWMICSYSKKSPKSFVNSSFLMSICISFVIAIIFNTYFFLVLITVFIITFAFFHGLIILDIERRARFVDKILPDALQLMAANSRAGHIPSKALLLSARKEFGPLSEAITKMGKEIMTGRTLEDSLLGVNKYIKSKLLERSIRLINEGIKSGGQFATLLDENAADIRRVQSIKKEIHANTLTYVIFMMFAGCVGAPLLYALSHYLIESIKKISSLAVVPESLVIQMPLNFMGGFMALDISSDFLLAFCLLAITITTVFSSIIISLISSGKTKDSIKYIPIFILLAFAIFFVTKFFIGSIIGIGIPG